MPREADDWDDPRGAEAYAEAGREGALYRELARRLADLAGPRPGELWIDLACGTGLAAEALAARSGPTARIVGADRAAAMLDVACREVPLGEVAFVLADPAALPLAARCADGAVCSAALWHLPAPRRAWGELARVLRPGGRAAVNVPVAQLVGEPDAPPTPLQLELAAAGRRRFGADPAPAGPRRTRASIVEEAAGASMHVDDERTFDVHVAQRELVALLHVPAIGARMYPDARPDERIAWIAEAEARVDLDERVGVRWWQALFRRARR